MKRKDKKQEQAEKRAAEKAKRRIKKQLSHTRKEEKEREEKIRILIVCEGKNTEPSYFNQFKVTSAIVKALGEGYNTDSLVKKAYQLQQQAIDKNIHYDQVWCVFDKDDYSEKQFKNAIKLSKQYGFGLAYSNQAFEYWLLLHLNDHKGGAMDRNHCNKAINKLIVPFGLYFDYNGSKVIEKELFEFLLAKDPKDIKNRTRQELAITRAEKILQFHKDNHTHPAQAESSTTVFHLVQELQKYM